MSSIQAQFDKAVAIVQGLPKDGPVKPSDDDRLYVRVQTPTTLGLLLISS